MNEQIKMIKITKNFKKKIKSFITTNNITWINFAKKCNIDTAIIPRILYGIQTHITLEEYDNISKIIDSSLYDYNNKKDNHTDTDALSDNKKADTSKDSKSMTLEINETAKGISSFTSDQLAPTICYTHAEGYNTNATGNGAHAEGYETYSQAESSHAEGYQTQVTGNYSHTEGYQTIVSGIASHAEGVGNTVSGDRSHAEGAGNTVSSDHSHTEGEGNTVSADHSHTEGGDNTVSGSYSHTEGVGNTIEEYAYCSHAEGEYNTVSGDHSHVEGVYNRVSSGYSHAEGYNNEASGDYSHAEGAGNTIGEYADYSHAEGEGNTIEEYAYCSHAEGRNNIVSNNYSHAEGYETIVTGNYSHAEGYHTIASNNYQHVGGKYNAKDENALFIIGNGTENNRSNAFTVNMDGTATIGTAPVNDMDVATKKYVDDLFASIKNRDNDKDIKKDFSIREKGLILKNEYDLSISDMSRIFNVDKKIIQSLLDNKEIIPSDCHLHVPVLISYYFDNKKEFEELCRMKRIIVSKYDKQKIIDKVMELYNSGVDAKKISDILHTSFNKINNILNNDIDILKYPHNTSGRQVFNDIISGDFDLSLDFKDTNLDQDNKRKEVFKMTTKILEIEELKESFNIKIEIEDQVLILKFYHFGKNNLEEDNIIKISLDNPKTYKYIINELSKDINNDKKYFILNLKKMDKKKFKNLNINIKIPNYIMETISKWDLDYFLED